MIVNRQELVKIENVLRSPQLHM